MYCPTCGKENVFIFQPIRSLVSTTVNSAKLSATFWIFFLGTKTWQLYCYAMIVHIALQEKRVAATRKNLLFRRNFSNNHNRTHPNLSQKRQQFLLCHNRVDNPLFGTVKPIFLLHSHLYTFSVQYSNMIFSVSNDRIEWSPDFGPDSVNLVVKHHVHKRRKSSQKLFWQVGACCCLRDNSFWTTF